MAFDAEVGRLTAAAIDAAMVEVGWVIEGGLYVFTSGPAATANIATVARPAAEGTGGGQFAWRQRQPGAPDAYDVLDFGSVRGQIQTIVQRWRVLPKPTAYAPDVSSLGMVADGLGRQGTVAQAVQAAAGTMSGLTATAFTSFRERFVDGLVTVVINLGYVFSSVRISRAVEMELWRRVEDDRLAVVSAAADAMQAVAGTGGGSGAVALTAPGAIAAAGDAQSSAAPTGAGASIVGAVTGVVFVTQLGSSVGARSVSIGGGGYGAVLRSLATGLDAINDVITETETAIVSAASETMRAMAESAPRFDLAALDIPEREPELAYTIDDAAGQRAVTQFSEAAESLGALATRAGGGVTVGAGTRTALGIGATGPATALDALSGTAAAHLQSTKETLAWGVRGLDDVLTEFRERDALNGAQARQLLEYLETYS